MYRGADRTVVFGHPHLSMMEDHRRLGYHGGQKIIGPKGPIDADGFMTPFAGGTTGNMSQGLDIPLVSIRYGDVSAPVGCSIW